MALTAERIAEIRDMLETASPAPWGIRMDYAALHGRVIFSGRYEDNYTICHTTNDWTRTLANEQLIAAAPTIIAELLDALEAPS